jgi:hypothetical protein
VNANCATAVAEKAPQAMLPFTEGELLRVRITQAQFARAMGVDRATVHRWVCAGHIALGADGRLDPNVAMRQLLKNSDPGRFRTRLVRQAFADINDLRSEAMRAGALAQQVADLVIQMNAARDQADIDYQQVDDWLDTFARRVEAIPQDTRARLDDPAWRAHVKYLLLDVMQTENVFAEIDREIAELIVGPMPEAEDLEAKESPRASGERRGGGGDSP